jgi:hypothetical protein
LLPIIGLSVRVNVENSVILLLTVFISDAWSVFPAVGESVNVARLLLFLSAFKAVTKELIWLAAIKSSFAIVSGLHIVAI